MSLTSCRSRSRSSPSAIDARRGSTHTVPIVNGVADFNAPPTGELIVRATPRATLFLANESIGSTPPAKPVTLPVVHVTAGAKAQIHMKMTE